MEYEDLELNLQKLSYIEMCYKLYYVNNQPFIKKVGHPIDADLQEIGNEFVHQMVGLYGKEDSSFLGTGILEKGSLQVSLFENTSSNEQDERSLISDALISEAADIAIMRVPRYLDLSEIFDSISILCVLNGEFSLSIGNKAFYLNKGSVAIIPPSIKLHLMIDNDDTVVLALIIRTSSFIRNFQCVFESGSSCTDFFTKMLYDKEHTPFSIFKSSFDEYLKELLFRIMILQYEPSEFQNLMLRNYTECFLLHLFSQYEENMVIYDDNIKVNELVSRVLVYMHQNYSTVTLKDVSKEFSYSSAHISRVLYQGLGKNYQDLITEIRLNKARELLSNTALGIEDICHILGYSNPRHLRFLFNKAYSISPSQYRKKYSQK